MNKNIQKKEKQFHDKWAQTVKIDEVMVDEFFEARTSPENNYILKQMGNITGKKILELGCGLGEAAVYLAKKGGDVVATDISTGMLQVTQQLASKHNVNLETKQSTTYKIEFPDEIFDIVYAANLLHHVDIKAALKEIHRVLKKGGEFYSWDPLAHNPIINIYRKKAMEVRTEDEHPIKMKELKLFKNQFSEVKYHTTWLFTLWIFISYYFFARIDPNKERYWKKILVDHKKLEKKYSRLEKLDRFFLKLFPFFKRYCWNIVIISKK
jgi:ubiquinone/menaquinone biosynthesis C-methylase UbiE